MAAPDKFRATITAREAASAIAQAAERRGWTCDVAAVADGGEGTLDVLGGGNRRTMVTGPLGDLVEARWRYGGNVAVIETALASGLMLVGGSEGNDPVAATTYGTGELIGAAVDAGCRRIIVGVGGSATTDGGLGALRALEPLVRLKRVEIVVACDVETTFLDAAAVFAPQKGASPAQVAFLQRRLERLAQLYEGEYGTDVRRLRGSGAAGGLAGGLAVTGADLVPGFDVVADEIGLAERLKDADLVVTGEGFLDEESFHGKAVGGVTELAADAGVPVLVVAGDRQDGLAVSAEVEVVSLVDGFGRDAAMRDTAACLVAAVAERLGRDVTRT